ncbi:hypothetical protein CCHR01_15456 [Colletotrichum chrysophilum]|uniref:Uncharacterized protein n=1 Tax=Colletotrichum chrysophilum TaxID=1836956 RepID=A0AAD9A6M5_9PEZI|nr:hypothetical protein K456DRAFT_53661 [Colletotrichum gloeosporioides 23]KAK1841925.1 hypothetical protein CCHR01_15456 [Colletotrichum chrysophilum]
MFERTSQIHGALLESGHHGCVGDGTPRPPRRDTEPAAVQKRVKSSSRKEGQTPQGSANKASLCGRALYSWRG